MKFQVTSDLTHLITQFDCGGGTIIFIQIQPWCKNV